MATPRDRRRIALLAMYQLDARGENDGDSIRASLAEAAHNQDDPVGLAPNTELSEIDLDRAYELALAAHRFRESSDAAMLELAPEWPAHRQAAMDRAVLRLAHYEMTAGMTPPKVAVNEAVELAKSFGGEKSPGFVNALLDKILKRVLAAQGSDPV